nr:lim domain-containing protein c4f6.12 [Quercus suber]
MHPILDSSIQSSASVEDLGLPSVQTASYLSGLRTGRGGRPSGSRPPPESRFSKLKRAETDIQKPVPEPEKNGRPDLHPSASMPIIPHLEHSDPQPPSISRRTSQFVGRPLVRPPSGPFSVNPEASHSNGTPVLRATPSLPYIERGSRWMERQEAKSLRMALEDMDLETEKEVHKNAQDEAAELVWKHKHSEAALRDGQAPYVNPDLTTRDYRSHLRKGSYERSQAAKMQSSQSGDHSTFQSMDRSSRRISTDVTDKVNSPTAGMSVQKRRTSSGHAGKSYGDLAEAVATDIAIAHRRTSSGSKRIMSGDKKIYMHPNDRIWEDPQEGTTSATIPPVIFEAREDRPAASPIQSAHVRKNPFARIRLQQDAPERSNSAPVLPVTKHNRVEIQRNPPTQSRNAWYTSNDRLPSTPPARDHAENDAGPDISPTKDGKEIRSDDIRAATSKQRKDRSPNLPQPTIVSDKPGRPIVSFQQRKEILLKEMQSSPPLPRANSGNSSHATKTAPALPTEPTKRSPEPSRRGKPQLDVGNQPSFAIPTINVPEQSSAIPSIVLPDEPDYATRNESNVPMISVDIPTINVSEAGSLTATQEAPAAPRPLPVPARPLPQHSASSPLPRSTPHYTPSIRHSSVLCVSCALPIAGRILSAGGSRFHPSCFVCHVCTTNLELVAFYPEPEPKRLARAQDSDVDPSPRFYCHLDFHENFSPRCKSCKTPIEGEVIVACGAEWHAGHFFCAQCGDPFDAKTPFVEKDGYAWCVGCHTSRYSAKCRKCRKPVTEVVVKALGAEWHDTCFVCMECNGDFHDGRYFLRGEAQDPVCVKCYIVNSTARHSIISGNRRSSRYCCLTSSLSNDPGPNDPGSAGQTWLG